MDRESLEYEFQQKAIMPTIFNRLPNIDTSFQNDLLIHSYFEASNVEQYRIIKIDKKNVVQIIIRKDIAVVQNNDNTNLNANSNSNNINWFCFRLINNSKIS